MKRRGRRVPPALVALSSAAILAVYAAGWVRTDGVAQAAGGADRTLPSPAPIETAPPTPRIGIGAPVVPIPPDQPIPARPVAPAPASYRDGTYGGLGMSRHGDIGVSVVVLGGRLDSVTITACLTRYPCSLIAGLPGQVVRRQKPAVDSVSGATDSSDAFQAAVANALRKAT